MAEALKPINGSGLQLTPFNTHKRWTVTDDNFRGDYYQMSILKGISPEFNEKILISGSLGLPSTQLTNSGSNSTSFLKGKHQKVIYSGINQMFFKHRTNIERDLYVSASIFSIPHNRMGDGIKPGTISNVDYSISSSNISTPLTITDSKLDEYHGYLIQAHTFLLVTWWDIGVLTMKLSLEQLVSILRYRIEVDTHIMPLVRM